MTRSFKYVLGAVALMAVLPGCRSGRGPSAGGPSAPVAPARVQELVGQTRILRHRGDERKLTLKREDLARLGGNCDAAVQVRQAALEGGTLRLALNHVGRPNIGGRRTALRRRICPPVAESVVTVSRVTSAEALDGTLHALLPTAEQYLRTNGTPFDRDPGPAPPFGAADGIGTTDQERILHRQVSTWPVVLLTVDADVPAARHVGRRESEVDFVAIVGADGRLHAAKVNTPLSDEHEKQLMRALSLWRYQPARSASSEIPAKVNGKAVLRLY